MQLSRSRRALTSAQENRSNRWLGGRRKLPQETRAYVRIVTGGFLCNCLLMVSDSIQTSCDRFAELIMSKTCRKKTSHEAR
jgi:hypothetical protein